MVIGYVGADLKSYRIFKSQGFGWRQDAQVFRTVNKHYVFIIHRYRHFSIIDGIAFNICHHHAHQGSFSVFNYLVTS